MICPHCGKELSTTTFINPMQHVQGCVAQPLYLNLQANGAAGGAGTIVTFPNLNLNVCAGGAAVVPQVTFIKF